MLNHHRLWKKKTLHNIQYSLCIYFLDPVLAAVAHIAVVSDMEKEKKERHRGEQHPASNVTPIKTCCIIYTGREVQHLSCVCQEAGDSL